MVWFQIFNVIFISKLNDDYNLFYINCLLLSVSIYYAALKRISGKEKGESENDRLATLIYFLQCE